MDSRTVPFVSGHGDFNFKLFSLNLIDSALCSCRAIEDSNHALLSCPLYEEQRFELKRFSSTCKDTFEHKKTLIG